MRAHGRSKWFRLIKEKNHNMRSGHVQAARRARSPSWTGMDILKELFGTSDELQISKSLFGSDASSTPVELGLDHPLPSPSRDYLSSRPLPLLPVEPRPQNTATSSLVRSHSLDDIQGPASNEVDATLNIFRSDSLRSQSVFPQLSETGTTNHVHLHHVPYEMPMYLLEDDEGNDEEIMRLLETAVDSTPSHSGSSSGRVSLLETTMDSTPSRSGSSSGSGRLLETTVDSTPSRSCSSSGRVRLLKTTVDFTPSHSGSSSGNRAASDEIDKANSPYTACSSRNQNSEVRSSSQSAATTLITELSNTCGRAREKEQLQSQLAEARSILCLPNGRRGVANRAPIAMDAATIETVAMEMVAMETEEVGEAVVLMETTAGSLDLSPMLEAMETSDVCTLTGLGLEISERTSSRCSSTSLPPLEASEPSVSPVRPAGGRCSLSPSLEASFSLRSSGSSSSAVDGATANPPNVLTLSLPSSLSVTSSLSSPSLPPSSKPSPSGITTSITPPSPPPTNTHPPLTPLSSALPSSNKHTIQPGTLPTTSQTHILVSGSTNSLCSVSPAITATDLALSSALSTHSQSAVSESSSLTNATQELPSHCSHRTPVSAQSVVLHSDHPRQPSSLPSILTTPTSHISTPLPSSIHLTTPHSATSSKPSLPSRYPATLSSRYLHSGINARSTTTTLSLSGAHVYHGRRHSVSPPRLTNLTRTSAAVLTSVPVSTAGATQSLQTHHPCSVRPCSGASQSRNELTPISTLPLSTPVLPHSTQALHISTLPLPLYTPASTPALEITTPLPLASTPALSVCTPTPVLQAPPLPPPPTSIQKSIERLKEQVMLQGQRLEQALKSFLPHTPSASHNALSANTTSTAASVNSPVSLQNSSFRNVVLGRDTSRPVPTSTDETGHRISTPSISTSARSSFCGMPSSVTPVPMYPSIRNTGFTGRPKTPISSWLSVEMAGLQNLSLQSFSYPSIRNTGFEQMSLNVSTSQDTRPPAGITSSANTLCDDDGESKEAVESGSPTPSVPVTMCSVAIQAGTSSQLNEETKHQPHSMPREEMSPLPTQEVVGLGKGRGEGKKAGSSGSLVAVEGSAVAMVEAGGLCGRDEETDLVTPCDGRRDGESSDHMIRDGDHVVRDGVSLDHMISQDVVTTPSSPEVPLQVEVEETDQKSSGCLISCELRDHQRAENRGTSVEGVTDTTTLVAVGSVGSEPDVGDVQEDTVQDSANSPPAGDRVLEDSPPSPLAACTVSTTGLLSIQTPQPSSSDNSESSSANSSADISAVCLPQSDDSSPCSTPGSQPFSCVADAGSSTTGGSVAASGSVVTSARRTHWSPESCVASESTVTMTTGESAAAKEISSGTAAENETMATGDECPITAVKGATKTSNSPVTVELPSLCESSAANKTVATTGDTKCQPAVEFTLDTPPSTRLSFRPTFSVCVPSMGWRVQPFGQVLGMKALPITILPPQPEREAAVQSEEECPRQPPEKRKRRRNGGGWPKGKKRKTAETTLPKPPSTAYGLYLSEQRQSLGEGLTFRSMSQLSKTIGRMWGQLPAHVKQEYNDRAARDSQRYLEELKSHLNKRQKDNSSSNFDAVDSVLSQCVESAENNDVLVCQLCKLTFTSLHNKHSHYSGRTHRKELNKELNRLMKEKMKNSCGSKEVVCTDGSEYSNCVVMEKAVDLTHRHSAVDENSSELNHMAHVEKDGEQSSVSFTQSSEQFEWDGMADNDDTQDFAGGGDSQREIEHDGGHMITDSSDNRFDDNTSTELPATGGGSSRVMSSPPCISGNCSVSDCSRGPSTIEETAHTPLSMGVESSGSGHMQHEVADTDHPNSSDDRNTQSANSAQNLSRNEEHFSVSDEQSTSAAELCNCESRTVDEVCGCQESSASLPVHTACSEGSNELRNRNHKDGNPGSEVCPQRTGEGLPVATLQEARLGDDMCDVSGLHCGSYSGGAAQSEDGPAQTCDGDVLGNYGLVQNTDCHDATNSVSTELHNHSEIQDAPFDDGTVPIFVHTDDHTPHSSSNCSDHTVQDASILDDVISEGNSRVSCDVATSLVEWAQGYAGMVSELKQQMSVYHSTLQQYATLQALTGEGEMVESGQTSFLNELRAEERGLLQHTDSLLSLLHRLAPPDPH